MKAILKDSMIWQLGEGKVSIWSQAWCNLDNDIHDYINLDSIPTNMLEIVADLWTRDKTWNLQKLNLIFNDHAVHKITQVQINQQDVEDKLCWKHTNNGLCSSKSAYKKTRKRKTQHSHQVSAQTLSILMHVWKDKLIPPNVKPFAWRLLRGALPSAQRLNCRIQDISSACCRCGIPESEFHRFFSCPFSKLSWYISEANISTDIFPHEAKSNVNAARVYIRLSKYITFALSYQKMSC